MKKFFLFATALLMSASMFAKTSVITYTAEEKLPEATDAGKTVGLHLNAFYAADSTQLTVTHTFDEAEGVGTITLDGEVAIIGDYAFYQTGLTSVTIPAGVTEIGMSAINNCYALQSITIPASVTTIGEAAFAYCFALASVTFLGNACQDAIGEDAFTYVGNTTPALLTLPDNWTGSKPDANGNWYSGRFTLAAPAKTSVITYTAEEKLPETTETGNVEGLHLNAFYTADSTQLTVTHTFDEAEGVGTITLDGEVAIIGTNAFYHTSITSVTLPASVTTIGERAFLQCRSLSSITLPEGLKTIGKRVFESCDALSTITIPSSVTTIGETAFNCCGIESITFAEGSQLTTIAEGAFFYSTLKSIDIPASVTEIGLGAFQACSALQSVTIAASVTTIGGYAFYNCSVLASVTFLGDACQNAIGEVAFGNVGATTPALLTLHGTWAKENQPDEDGNWYGGKFELAEDPTTLPQTRAAVKATKVMTNGQVIFRAENKNFSILGQEVR